MLDGYGREIDYLRISITDKCNLRCRYCMPEDIEHVAMKEILSFEEIVQIVTAAEALGINRIKITGGEPLVRRDCSKLIGMLKNIPGIKQVTLTTNGVLLKNYLDDLYDAGIDGINISLDTIDRERYRLITGSDKLLNVLEGLDHALEKGLHVKINAVSVDWNGFPKKSGRNEDHVYDFSDAFGIISLAKDRDVDVRFIEMMPIGFGRGFSSISHDILIPAIREKYLQLTSDEKPHGNGPAVYMKIPGFKGSLGFISALHGIFCKNCNRVRLTTQGYLKSCLCYETGTDLKKILRGGGTEEEKIYALKTGIREAILCKPQKHSFNDISGISEKKAMSAIGG